MAFGSISSQRPAFFSLTLLIHRHTENGNDKGAHQLHLWSKRYVVIHPKWLQLCKSCRSLCNPWDNLLFRDIIWYNCFKVLGTCSGTQLLSFNLELPLDTTNSFCHQFGLPSTDLHLTPCQVVREFQIGLLVPALPQLEHNWHRQTAGW